MSHKTIYICDRCDSYIADENKVVTVKISVAAHYTDTPYRQYVGAKVCSRELCAECVKKTGEEFLLDVGEETLVEQKFKDFDLTRDEPGQVAE